MKNSLWSIFLGLAIILSTYIAAYAFMNRYKSTENIHVKGLSQRNFTSDLIVWNASFTRTAPTLQQAYRQIARDRNIVKKYLTKNGIKPKDLTFMAIDTKEKYHSYYDDKDNYHQEFVGYSLTQDFRVQSKDVEKVENISRKISELIDQGIYLTSQAPKYFYTKLDELKIEMIAEATENARIRAEQIAQKSGAHLGKLQNATLGIFQITGQYSDEDYTWGGAFNTSSKEKTATVTVTANFKVR